MGNEVSFFCQKQDFGLVLLNGILNNKFAGMERCDIYE